MQSLSPAWFADYEIRDAVKTHLLMPVRGQAYTIPARSPPALQSGIILSITQVTNQDVEKLSHRLETLRLITSGDTVPMETHLWDPLPNSRPHITSSFHSLATSQRGKRHTGTSLREGCVGHTACGRAGLATGTAEGRRT